MAEYSTRVYDSIEIIKDRSNVRGFVRKEDSRKFIVQICPAPVDARVSSKALRLLVGMTSLEGGGILPTPVSCLQHDPLQGMCVTLPGKEAMPVYRALLLIKGTHSTELLPLDPKAAFDPMAAFKVISKNVQCELKDSVSQWMVSGKNDKITLEGYCYF